MKALNPQIVQVPDGRVGCLVARHGMQGCIEFGRQRMLETYPLNILYYHFTMAPRPTRRRMSKV